MTKKKVLFANCVSGSAGPRESEGIRGNEGASSELAAGVPVEVRVRLVHEWRGEDAVSRELRHGAAHGIVTRELHDRGGGTRV